MKILKNQYWMSVAAIGPSVVRLWLVLLIFAFCSLCDLMEFAAREPDAVFRLVGLSLYAVFKATLLTAGWLLCRPVKWIRALAAIFIGLFLFFSFVNAGCWAFYGFGVTRKLVTILYETNPKEISEFLPNLGHQFGALFANWRFWIAIAAFALLWRGLPRISRKWLFAIILPLAAAGGGYFVFVFATAEFGKTDHVITFRTSRCVYEAIRDTRNIRELLREKRPLPDAASASTDFAAERVTVVIGESASRDHLGLYGYPLPTTPRLDTISDGLYIFRDAMGSSSSTAANLPRMLTFMTDEPQQGEWYEYPTMLQLFKALGYSTAWISNQERSGMWSNLSAILIHDADLVEYVGAENSEDHYMMKYDEAILPEWRKFIDSSKGAHVAYLHLMGSHLHYHNRYPRERTHFTAADVIEKTRRRSWMNTIKAGTVAEYDNSILYTDSILAEVIATLKASDRPEVMVYVADHGEDVYDDRDYWGRDKNFVHVPFLIYANEAYRRKNPEIVADIERAVGRKFSTSETPQLLLHLTGSRYSLYAPKRDVLSPEFVERPRYVDDEKF